MVATRALPVLQIDELVDYVLFNEHHDTTRGLFLYTVKLVVAPSGDHDWRLFGLALAGCY